MATVITELQSKQALSANVPARWMLNISSDDLSAGVVVRAGEPGKKHWIDHITVTHRKKEWFKVLSGSDVLIGPIETQEGAPWSYHCTIPVACTAGDDLKVQTKSGSTIHILLEGHTDAYPQFVFDPSPADGTTNRSVEDRLLTWESSPLMTRFDVYVNGVWQATTPDKSHYLDRLDYDTEYTWRVDTGGSTGQTWTFRTEDEV